MGAGINVGRALLEDSGQKQEVVFFCTDLPMWGKLIYGSRWSNSEASEKVSLDSSATRLLTSATSFAVKTLIRYQLHFSSLHHHQLSASFLFLSAGFLNPSQYCISKYTLLDYINSLHTRHGRVFF